MSGSTSFWRTVGLLLRASRRRSSRRAVRQRQQLTAAGKQGASWGTAPGLFLSLLVNTWVQGGMAVALFLGLLSAQNATAERHGRLLVTRSCYEQLAKVEPSRPYLNPARADAFVVSDQNLHALFRGQGREIEIADRDAYEAQLVVQFQRFGRVGFVPQHSAWGLARDPVLRSPIATWFGSLLLLIWFVALALQGEGLILDLQRRRHPMLEWLFSHPVDSRAVFLGEMLTPLSANPMFWVAPCFWMGVYWIAYDDFIVGTFAGFIAGLPLCVAAGCIGKAIELAAMLRLPPRSRGAVLAIMSWIGVASLMVLVAAASSPLLLLAFTRLLGRLVGDTHAPLLEWALGLQGTPSPWRGVATCWVAAAGGIALAAQFSTFAIRRGLAGGFDSTVDPAPAVLSSRFLRNPVYRKELLWLWRDRGAIVQVFIIPLTIAGFQLFNLRMLLVKAAHAWYLCAGAAVLFGSYFIATVGPRALASEGTALWIPLTWPRSLETLLKAKARLWWLVSLAIVCPVLALLAFHFHADAWKLALVAVAWAVCGHSLAERAVTLVSAPSNSGEPEPLPRGRVWAATVGTLTLGVSILSQQWHLACVGIVYLWLISAATWLNFRAHLPYLFDPWSDQLPTPPTLMHSMVAIVTMTEVIALSSGVLLAFVGHDMRFFVTSMVYGVSGLGTWIIMTRWLARRGVSMRHVWCWSDNAVRFTSLALACAAALGLGLALGIGASGYANLVQRIPEWGQGIRANHDFMIAHASERWWLALLAVGFAPWAEEYLFRGLLFRAFDREWSGARAIWSSAAFFAIYHPPLAWLPVAALGATSAWLFKRSGYLLPCVLLHMTYNAVVTASSWP